jgi:hypothetical protein
MFTEERLRAEDGGVDFAFVGSNWGQNGGLPACMRGAAHARAWTRSRLAALRRSPSGHHGMEEVRGSSPLSSTIEHLVRPPFVTVAGACPVLG